MKMPTKGSLVTVDGYGTAIFAGATGLDNPEEGKVLLKFERGEEIREGYGKGIIEVSYPYFKENRIYPHESIENISTEKRQEELGF